MYNMLLQLPIAAMKCNSSRFKLVKMLLVVEKTSMTVKGDDSARGKGLELQPIKFRSPEAIEKIPRIGWSGS